LRTSPCLSPRACLSPHTCLSLLPFCTAKVPMGLNTKNCNERHATCKKKLVILWLQLNLFRCILVITRKFHFKLNFFFPSWNMIATEIIFLTMCVMVWITLQLILIRIQMSARQTLQLSTS
jgi:hypothetical protein